MARPSKKGAKSEAEVAAEAKRKKEILDKVTQSNLPTKTILKELGISRSTYYSWLKRYEEEGDEGLLDSRSLTKAEEKVEEAAPAVEEAEPRVTEVEPVEEVAEEPPTEPVAETIAEVEPTPTVAEELVTTPEEPVVASMEEEPKEREEVILPEETPPFSGDREKKGVGLYAFVAILLLLLGLLFSVSLSNYKTYKLRETSNTLTLWKGKFAARGFEMVESFEPVEVGDSDVSALTNRTYAGEDAVYKAIYAFLMDQIVAEVAKGNEADSGKISALMAKAESVVGANARGDASFANIRYQLAEKRVAIAEMELKEAYEKALPVYEEAARMGLGDVAILEAKIEVMREALAPIEAEEVEAEPAAEPEQSEAVTPAAPEAPAEEVEASTTVETPAKEAESGLAPEASAEEDETVAAPTEQGTASEEVEQESKGNNSTSFMDWVRSKD